MKPTRLSRKKRKIPSLINDDKIDELKTENKKKTRKKINYFYFTLLFWLHTHIIIIIIIFLFVGVVVSLLKNLLSILTTTTTTTTKSSCLTNSKFVIISRIESCRNHWLYRKRIIEKKGIIFVFVVVVFHLFLLFQLAINNNNNNNMFGSIHTRPDRLIRTNIDQLIDWFVGNRPHKIRR